MITDAERHARYENRSRGENVSAPTEAPAPGFSLTSSQIRTLTPGAVQAMLRDGHAFTDCDMVSMHQQNPSAWAEARDLLEHQRQRAEAKPAQPSVPHVHASPSDARTLGAMLMRLTAVMQAPVRPVYDERGVLVRGERDLSAVPELPAVEPEPAPKTKTKKDPHDGPATVRMVFSVFDAIKDTLIPEIRALRQRVDALESKPHLKFRGVWMSAEQYMPGDISTFQGSMWHCNQSTVDRPGTSDSWVLCVKRGKDARS